MPKKKVLPFELVLLSSNLSSLKPNKVHLTEICLASKIKNSNDLQIGAWSCTYRMGQTVHCDKLLIAMGVWSTTIASDWFDLPLTIGDGIKKSTSLVFHNVEETKQRSCCFILSGWWEWLSFGSLSETKWWSLYLWTLVATIMSEEKGNLVFFLL